MMASSVRNVMADHRSDLAEIRGEVENMRDGLNERLATAGKALSKLSVERTDLQKERTMLKASLADKARVETELRAQLSDLKKKSTAGAGAEERQQSGGASTSSTTAAAAAVEMLNEANAEVARLKGEIASAAEEAAARASAAAAMGSTSLSGDRAAQMSLKGKEAEVAAMREELESQARNHRAQMTELQESCHAKLREMRRVHDAQLAAAKAEQRAPPPPQPPSQLDVDAAAEMTRLRKEHAEEVGALNADVARLKRELEACGERERAGLENAMNLADKERRKLVDGADAERRRFGAERAGLKAELEDASRQLARAKEDAAAAAAEAAAAARSGASASVAGAGGAQLDMEALDLMESQVVKLSNILQERERELAVLQATVEGQCAERHQLIAALQSYHDAAAAHGTGGGGGEQHSQHSSPTSKQQQQQAAAANQSPKSQAAAALANTNLMSPRKIGRKTRPVSMSKAFK